MVSTLQNTVEFLEDFGLFDVILPFLLIFAIVFAILEKTKILGKNKSNVNSIVALVFALLVITANKVITAITIALPNIALLLVVLISFLLMVGIFAKDADEEFHFGKGLTTAFGIMSFIGLIVIFLGAYTLESGISALSYFMSYLYDNTGNDIVGGIVLLGIIVAALWYVTKGSGEPSGDKGEDG